MMSSFDHVVANEQDLRTIIGTPGARSVLKERRALDEHDRAFIAQSPFVLMATSGADGRCDVSPKGDAPGFVQVLDDRRLVIPERPGNKRLDGMLNMMANPHVGLIFLVPGREETLRVNGTAWITRDPQLLERCIAQGKVPLVAIGVEIEQCFLHCPKAFIRSHLWDQHAWPAADALPSMACVLFDQIRPTDATLQDYERAVEEGNTKGLY
jgi:PPOX class probable FMN-dependent enzyme